MRYHEHEIIRLLVDLPEHGLKKGEIGVIVDAFDRPNEAYEVEFVDKDGKTKVQTVLLPHQFEAFHL
ncbi:uncharacterized protein DUF4926 [Planifilum fimeticola]|jgi:ATP-dependent exoDNAse (exonuclease V) alpha subunit|uniref:Uncharacterized protein DUF4926 n=1 Tax=Planifilum fimeticola TaxID=201975 RepID=A0A2T0LEG8_9BACL|nr:DUF4926 domain-containing protein [Planifilum fimeticola]PRX40503.1 uncharacterized protein DUF4926 [Planifilum fimeticola]